MSNKMLYRVISLMIFVSIMFSCTEKNVDFINIYLNNRESKSVKLSSIAKKLEYVPLSNDTLIGFIRKVVLDRSHFYIRANDSKLLRFNRNGKFELAIGHKGRGPGEFPILGDFTVSEDSGIIYVLGKRKKINKYDSEGNFLGDIDLSTDYSNRVEEYNGTILIHYAGINGNNQFSFELIGNNGKAIQKFHNIHKFKAGNMVIGFPGECLFYRNESELYFKEIYSDTVFCIKGSKMIPQYCLNSEEKKITPQMREDFKGEFEKFKNVILQFNLFEANGYIFYEYHFEKRIYLLVYNKKSLEQYTINGEEGFVNDIDGGMNVSFKTAIGDDMVLTWVDAYELKAHVASESFKNSTPLYPEKKKELEQLANSLDENDNPVLILVKLKE